MKKYITRLIGAILLLWFLYMSYHLFSQIGIKHGIQRMIAQPQYILLFLFTYSLSFYVRSVGWSILLSKPANIHSLFKYHMIGLFVNHLLPIKAGDGARIYLTAKNLGITWKESLQTVVYSRWLDIASLIVLAYTALWWWELPWFTNGWMIGLTIPIMLFTWIVWNRIQNKPHRLSTLLHAWIWILPGWVLEGFVLWSVLQALNHPLTFPLTVGINAVTIAGQVFHVTPGGLGTYESVMSILLHQVGYSFTDAFEIALISHGLKFFYSYVWGGWAVISLKVSKNELWSMIYRK